MIKAVIFDLYETLITLYDPDWKPPKTSMAERLGIEEEVFLRQWKLLAMPWRRGRPQLYEDVLAEVCRAVGREPDTQVIAELSRERYESRLPPFENVEPEILDMVEALRSRDLKLGVITNSTNGDVEPWPRSPLAPCFEALIASYRVGIVKPDPRIYEHCLRELGVAPAEAVFVGDAGNEAMNELEGAKRVGLRPYWATWFLDRWAPGTRRMPGPDPPFPRLRTPAELLGAVLGELENQHNRRGLCGTA